MTEEKLETRIQRENSDRKLFKKLVALAQNIISYEVGIPFAVGEMSKILIWLEQRNVKINLPVFEEYSTATRAIPTARERLYCSREALKNYDDKLRPINEKYHDKIIDACFTIILDYAEKADRSKIPIEE